MIFPEVIAYLLTLRYPGSELERGNFVCYRGVVQTILPSIPPGFTIVATTRPLHGVYAHLYWATRTGTDMVPNTMSGSIQQYGSTPWSGIATQRSLDDPAEYFVVVTDQEPAYVTMTNLSPLAQRWEVITDFIVIPTSQDLVIIQDALRRLHTSKESEELLSQANNLLGLLSGQPQEPRPPIGGP